MKRMAQPKEEEPIQETQTIFVSEYIAPWALPNEEIPVHLMWKSEKKFDQIHVLPAANMLIKELYNVKDSITSNSETIIKELFSPNFFGFTVISNKLTNKKHEKKEIIVKFLANGKVVHSRSFIANIYRPELSIMEKPNSVTLRDNSDPEELLDISLKISGFGSIEVTTEVSFGGKFEPSIEPLFQEMARRASAMYRKGDLTDTQNSLDVIPISKDASSLRKRKMEINPLFIRKTTRALIDQLKKGEFTLINENDIEDFKKWVKKEKNKKHLQRVLSEHLENIIIESILYYFNKYPTEGVALHGGSPSVIIRNAVQELRIRFKYRDSMLNEYDPMPVEIPVQDLRVDKCRELKIPINIKWIHEQVNPLAEGVKC
jgi:hypothetical protein